MSEAAAPHTSATRGIRIFCWSAVLLTAAFIINSYLSFWQDWPGVLGLLGGADAVNVFAILQGILYAAAIAGAAAIVMTSDHRTLREDSAVMNGVNIYIVRAAFYAVLFIGLADAVVSFLRVENLLVPVIGNELAEQLGRPNFRGTYVHMPLLALALVVAAVVRGLGFHWLALLVVASELLIVITRFIFAYEQAFMGDLVRFWYAALFLFASAYTLLEDGHVRVDVVYAGLSRKMRGLINAWGALLLGIVFCAVILTLGMWTKSSIITAAVISFEVSQSGYGMYVKYLMAAFLGIFATTMMIQFSSSLLGGTADYRGDPGAREPAGEGMH